MPRPMTAERARQEVEGAAPPAETPEAEAAQERFVEQLTTPTEPDEPGGQVATVNGQRKFIRGSTMYELGFRTEKEYSQAQTRGATLGLHEGGNVPEDTLIITTKGGKPYTRYTPQQVKGTIDPQYLRPYLERGNYIIPSKNWRGDTISIKGKDIKALSEATPEGQFKIASKLRLIPRGSKFVGGEDGGWTYIPNWAKIQREAKDIVAQNAALRQLKVYKEDGGYNLAAAKVANVPDKVLYTAGFTRTQVKAQEDMVSYMKASPKGKFELLQERGVIPTTATFKSIDKEGTIHYTSPDTTLRINWDSPELKALVSEFMSQSGATQRKVYLETGIQGYSTARQTPKWTDISMQRTLWGAGAKGRQAMFNVLTEEQKALVLTQWASRTTGDYKFLGIPVSKSVEYELRNPVNQIAISLVPVVGTIQYWDEMSTPWKALSVAADVFIVGGVFGLPGKLAGMLKGINLPRGASRAIKALQVTDKEAIKVLRQIEKTTKVRNLVRPYKRFRKVQARYADDYATMKDLGKTLESSLGELRPEVQRAYGMAVARTADSRALLLSRAEDYLRAVRRGIKFDDPRLIEAAKELPENLAKSTEALVDYARTGARSVRAIEADILRAEQKLKAARAKKPTDSSAWYDLAQEVSALQAELRLSQLGDIKMMYGKLLAARELLPKLDKMLRQAKAQRSPNVATLEETINGYRRIVRGYPKIIDDAIRRLEVEWGSKGTMGGGKMPARTLTPTRPLVGGGEGGTRLGLAVAPGILADVLSTTQVDFKISPSIEVRPSTMPGEKEVVSPGVWPVTGPEYEPLVYPGIRRQYGSRVRQSLFPYYAEQVKGYPSEGIEPGMVPAPGPESEPAPKPGEGTKAGQQVPEKATIQKPRTRILVTGGGREAEEEEKKRRRAGDSLGTIAINMGELKRGRVWWLYTFAPFKKRVLVGKKPAGAVEARGPKSGYRTAQRLRGIRVPKEFTDDIGIMDVKFVPVKGQRAVDVIFTPDPKQKTTGGVVIRDVKPTVIGGDKERKGWRPLSKERTAELERELGLGIVENRQGRRRIKLE